MKKSLALIMALALIIALAAACGGTTNTPAAGTPPAGGGSSSSGGTSSGGASSGSTAPAGNNEEPWADKPEVTLIFTQHDPDQSTPGRYAHEWAELVRQESRGRIEIQVNNGGVLAGPTESLDAVQSGAVDVMMSLPHFYPGRFPMTDMLLMPFLPYESSLQASKVFVDIWENSDLLYSDPGYDNVKLIMFRANCESPIITVSKKIEKASDLNGLTLRAAVAPLVTWLAEFGGIGQGCPIGELFQNMQNGTFDGAITDWNAVDSFRLHDNCAKYFADEIVQYGMHFLLMNQQTYDRLSPENQAAIDRCSGKAALEVMANAWDDLTIKVKKDVVDEFGGEVYKIPPDELKKLRNAADKTNGQYVASLGEPGRQLYELIKEKLGM